MRRLKDAVAVVFFAFAATGCAATGDHFDITVVNLGSHSVFDTHMAAEGFLDKAREIPPNIAATRGYVPQDGVKSPKQMIGSWTTSNGHRLQANIDLNMPPHGLAARNYGVPERVQWWHIVVAYMDGTVSSGWVLFDERHKKDPHFFGRQVLFGGDVNLLIREHLMTPELVGKVPRYVSETTTGPGMHQ